MSRFPLAAHAARLGEGDRDKFALYAKFNSFDRLLKFLHGEAAQALAGKPPRPFPLARPRRGTGRGR